MKIETIFKIFLYTMILILIGGTSVFASTLTLKLITDKEKYVLNDKVIVKVNWTEKMQAASFKIQYDSEKLLFESANISNDFYNSSETGEISINWVSMNENDFTELSFYFKAIKTGKANINIKSVEAFADGDVKSPTAYEYKTFGNKTIEINSKDITKIENENKRSTPNSDKTTDETYKGEKKEKLPQTGENDIYIFILFIIFSVTGIVSFIKYRKIQII